MSYHKLSISYIIYDLFLFLLFQFSLFFASPFHKTFQQFSSPLSSPVIYALSTVHLTFLIMNPSPDLSGVQTFAKIFLYLIIVTWSPPSNLAS